MQSQFISMTYISVHLGAFQSVSCKYPLKVWIRNKVGGVIYYIFRNTYEYLDGKLHSTKKRGMFSLKFFLFILAEAVQFLVHKIHRIIMLYKLQICIMYMRYRCKKAILPLSSYSLYLVCHIWMCVRNKMHWNLLLQTVSCLGKIAYLPGIIVEAIKQKHSVYKKALL